MKPLVYYAHCIAIYNTPQEKRDIETLAKLGFDVINPNTADCTEGYKKEGMAYFDRFAVSCDAIAFRALPNVAIPAGIAHEIEAFKKAGKPVVELPSAITCRVLTVDATREYLVEIGQR